MRNLWLDGTQSFEDLSNDPIPHLVEGLINQGSTVFLAGQPGTGKSFAAVSIAAAVASGTPWHGREVGQGRVLYVVAEDTPQRIRDRFLAWSAHNSTPLDFDELRYITSFDFSKPDTVQFLVDLVASIPVALVIVDTLFSASSGIDTESAKEVKVINEVIAQAKAASIAPLTFLTVSHANKSQAGTPSGSIQIKGMADAVLSMTKTRGSYRLGFDKNRHGDETLSLSFRIESVDLPGTNAPVGVLTIAGNDNKDAPEVKNFVAALFAELPPNEPVSQSALIAQALGLGLKSSRSTVIDWLSRAEKRGLLTSTGSRTSKTFSMTDNGNGISITNRQSTPITTDAPSLKDGQPVIAQVVKTTTIGTELI